MKVYFLPYLASMWRSMDCLYREHLEAGDEVHVMPIPFWGLVNGKREIAQYQGYEFPVDFEDYRKIDLKSEHPDKLYFHNPYDDRNTITSVDPAFYSPELRGMTGELIYVPYYTKAAGDLSSAVRAPGVQNADTVVTWTEAQKAAYEAGGAKHVILKKFQVPKVSARWEWMSMAAKGKHVILFNNSLGALIDSPEKEIEKICRLIRSFEKRDKDLLLWRPHPLYLHALGALFPQYMGQYQDLKRWFLEWNGGIYDVSWDVDRAVLWADEYMGDPSSVVTMFEEQGKKVTII